ncbi:MAG: outer membrane lipoprotein-sorting protein [Myxococcales bacterium]|nr:outer membrane lipoprotein-sorting protein [Myxococcales bacterium]
MQKFLSSICFVVLALSSQWVDAADGKPVPKGEWTGILEKVDKAEAQGRDMKARMVISLINKEGKRRERRAIFFQKGTDRRLIQFKAPASEAGISVLIRGTSVFLYLPQLQKTRRIAAHVKNQPFMGTDLSFDDMSSLQYSKENEVISANEKGELYHLVLKPKAGLAKPYIRLEMSVRKNDHQIAQIRFFDTQNKEYKRMERLGFRKFNGFSVPSKIQVKDMKSQHRTILDLQDMQLNTGVSGRLFSLRYLKRDLEL